MALTLGGAQNYRVINSQQGLIGDILLSPGDLTKYRNNVVGLSFLIPNPEYFGFAFQGTYSETKTDETLNGPFGLDSDNIGLSVRLYNGNNARKFSYELSGQTNETSRSNFQDFKSTSFGGRLGYSIANKIDLVVVGNSEEYDLDLETLPGRTNLDITSYGAGLEWKPTDEQAILLTYNQLDEGSTQTDFIAVNVNWAFSNRTLMKLDYGKRFFGDAYSLDFTHSLKSLRTSLTYSEQVTSFAQLGIINNSVGVFVCPFGATELFDCFQPDSIDYQLQAGEEFRLVNEIETDITEEVILRKTGRLVIGYDKRKLKASISASYNTTEYLESDRLQTIRRLSLNLSYDLGRKANISLTTSLSKDQFEEASDADTNIRISVDFRRQINRNLQLTTGFRLLDRESDNDGRDITDKRINLGLNYTF
jgi:uncharacterized protein (PEP-CTERM system associated)